LEVLIFKDIKNKRWTVWDKDKKKHLFYTDSITLENAKFIVMEDKRKKVIKSRKRFPHAWIIGTISKETLKSKKEITYNPFKDSHFQSKGKNVTRRKIVHFEDNGKVYA